VVARSRDHNRRELAFLEQELKARGVAYTPSVDELRAGRFRRRRVRAVRRVPEARRDHPAGRRPGLINCARVSVGTRAENEKFLAALDQLVPAAARR